MSAARPAVQEPALPTWRTVALGARPKTLLLALGPVALATALAWRQGTWSGPVALWAVLGALCLQVGTNLFNDWADAARGADGADRLGPLRVTASGLLPPHVVAWLATFFFALASVCGCALLARAPAWVLSVGLSGMLCGFAYTSGPMPLAYVGLGELFAFVYFGPVAVATTYRLHTGHLSTASVGLGVALGAFAAAVLAINNLRDRQGDARVGKRTPAVRFGPRVVRVAIAVLLISPTAIAWALAWAHPPLRGLAWVALCAPQAGALAWRLRPQPNARDGSALNDDLAQAARAQATFALVASVGLICG